MSPSKRLFLTCFWIIHAVLPATRISADTMIFTGELMELGFSDLLGGGVVSTVDPERIRGSLVVFWSVSCGPCLREIPELNALHREWASRGIRLIGLPQDERPEEVLGLCGRFGVRWPQYLESGPSGRKPAAARWGVTDTPTFFLLDGQGRVLEHGFTDPRAALLRHFG